MSTTHIKRPIAPPQSAAPATSSASSVNRHDSASTTTSKIAPSAPPPKPQLRTGATAQHTGTPGTSATTTKISNNKPNIKPNIDKSSQINPPPAPKLIQGARLAVPGPPSRNSPVSTRPSSPAGGSPKPNGSVSKTSSLDSHGRPVRVRVRSGSGIAIGRRSPPPPSSPPPVVHPTSPSLNKTKQRSQEMTTDNSTSTSSLDNASTSSTDMSVLTTQTSHGSVSGIRTSTSHGNHDATVHATGLSSPPPAPPRPRILPASTTYATESDANESQPSQPSIASQKLEENRHIKKPTITSSSPKPPKPPTPPSSPQTPKSSTPPSSGKPPKPPTPPPSIPNERLSSQSSPNGRKPPKPPSPPPLSVGKAKLPTLSTSLNTTTPTGSSPKPPKPASSPSSPQPPPLSAGKTDSPTPTNSLNATTSTGSSREPPKPSSPPSSVGKTNSPKLRASLNTTTSPGPSSKPPKPASPPSSPRPPPPSVKRTNSPTLSTSTNRTTPTGSSPKLSKPVNAPSIANPPPPSVGKSNLLASSSSLNMTTQSGRSPRTKPVCRPASPKPKVPSLSASPNSAAPTGSFSDSSKLLKPGSSTQNTETKILDVPASSNSTIQTDSPSHTHELPKSIDSAPSRPTEMSIDTTKQKITDPPANTSDTTSISRTKFDTAKSTSKSGSNCNPSSHPNTTQVSYSQGALRSNNSHISKPSSSPPRANIKRSASGKIRTRSPKPPPPSSPSTPPASSLQSPIRNNDLAPSTSGSLTMAIDRSSTVRLHADSTNLAKPAATTSPSLVADMLASTPDASRSSRSIAAAASVTKIDTNIAQTLGDTITQSSALVTNSHTDKHAEPQSTISAHVTSTQSDASGVSTCAAESRTHTSVLSALVGGFHSTPSATSTSGPSSYTNSNSRNADVTPPASQKTTESDSIADASTNASSTVSIQPAAEVSVTNVPEYRTTSTSTAIQASTATSTAQSSTSSSNIIAVSYTTSASTAGLASVAGVSNVDCLDVCSGTSVSHDTTTYSGTSVLPVRSASYSHNEGVQDNSRKYPIARQDQSRPALQPASASSALTKGISASVNSSAVSHTTLRTSDDSGLNTASLNVPIPKSNHLSNSHKQSAAGKISICETSSTQRSTIRNTYTSATTSAYLQQIPVVTEPTITVPEVTSAQHPTPVVTSSLSSAKTKTSSSSSSVPTTTTAESSSFTRPSPNEHIADDITGKHKPSKQPQSSENITDVKSTLTVSSKDKSTKNDTEFYNSVSKAGVDRKSDGNTGVITSSTKQTHSALPTSGANLPLVPTTAKLKEEFGHSSTNLNPKKKVPAHVVAPLVPKPKVISRSPKSSSDPPPVTDGSKDEIFSVKFSKSKSSRSPKDVPDNSSHNLASNDSSFKTDGGLVSELKLNDNGGTRSQKSSQRDKHVTQLKATSGVTTTQSTSTIKISSSHHVAMSTSVQHHTKNTFVDTALLSKATKREVSVSSSAHTEAEVTHTLKSDISDTIDTAQTRSDPSILTSKIPKQQTTHPAISSISASQQSHQTHNTKIDASIVNHSKHSSEGPSKQTNDLQCVSKEVSTMKHVTTHPMPHSNTKVNSGVKNVETTSFSSSATIPVVPSFDPPTPPDASTTSTILTVPEEFPNQKDTAIQTKAHSPKLFLSLSDDKLTSSLIDTKLNPTVLATDTQQSGSLSTIDASHTTFASSVQNDSTSQRSCVATTATEPTAITVSQVVHNVTEVLTDDNSDTEQHTQLRMANSSSRATLTSASKISTVPVPPTSFSRAEINSFTHDGRHGDVSEKKTLHAIKSTPKLSVNGKIEREESIKSSLKEHVEDSEDSYDSGDELVDVFGESTSVVIGHDLQNDLTDDTNENMMQSAQNFISESKSMTPASNAASTQLLGKTIRNHPIAKDLDGAQARKPRAKACHETRKANLRERQLYAAYLRRQSQAHERIKELSGEVRTLHNRLQTIRMGTDKYQSTMIQLEQLEAMAVKRSEQISSMRAALSNDHNGLYQLLETRLSILRSLRIEADAALAGLRHAKTELLDFASHEGLQKQEMLEAAVAARDDYHRATLDVLQEQQSMLKTKLKQRQIMFNEVVRRHFDQILHLEHQKQTAAANLAALSEAISTKRQKLQYLTQKRAELLDEVVALKTTLSAYDTADSEKLLRLQQDINTLRRTNFQRLQLDGVSGYTSAFEQIAARAQDAATAKFESELHQLQAEQQRKLEELRTNGTKRYDELVGVLQDQYTRKFQEAVDKLRKLRERDKTAVEQLQAQYEQTIRLLHSARDKRDHLLRDHEVYEQECQRIREVKVAKLETARKELRSLWCANCLEATRARKFLSRVLSTAPFNQQTYDIFTAHIGRLREELKIRRDLARLTALSRRLEMSRNNNYDADVEMQLQAQKMLMGAENLINEYQSTFRKTINFHGRPATQSLQEISSRLQAPHRYSKTA